MIRKWEVDDATVVIAKIGGLTKNTLTVNSKTLPLNLSLRKKNERPFILGDGRPASLAVKPQFGSAPIVELRVAGRLMVETTKDALKCAACGTAVKTNDQFCASCGKQMPPAEDYAHRKNVKEASKMIWILAALFLVFGIGGFFLQKSQIEAPLAKIAHMKPSEVIQLPGGAACTAAQVRAQLEWQPWGALIVNLVLSGVMAILALWARKAPLAALLVATATYAVLIVTNAIIDPRTIAQGLLMKIIVILLLIRGIKAALALRKADA